MQIASAMDQDRGTAGSHAPRGRDTPVQAPLEPGPAEGGRGVWLVRGDLMRGMNVYLLEEPGGGVTAFDSGTRPMAKAILKAAERLGGLKRVVLGHSHSDHRVRRPRSGRPSSAIPARGRTPKNRPGARTRPTGTWTCSR